MAELAILEFDIKEAEGFKDKPKVEILLTKFNDLTKKLK